MHSNQTHQAARAMAGLDASRLDELPEQYREWLIDFGDSSYVARYRIDDEAITILAIRHQKEAGN